MNRINEKKATGIYITIIVLFCVLFYRLYTLSGSDVFEAVPSLGGQYSRTLEIATRRGFIFDRSGETIAGFPEGTVILIEPAAITIPYESAASLISSICGSDKEAILIKIMEGQPFVVHAGRTLNENWCRNFTMYTRYNSKSYPALHLLGYLGGDGAGICGIEAVYNEFLSDTSVKVFAKFNTDAIHNRLAGLPVRIYDYDYNTQTGITLTLDYALQREIERIADNMFEKGAIIVTDIKTGEVLASISRPDYDISKIADYTASTDGEFINRALSAFTPGSFFKTIIAAAAIEENPQISDMRYICSGSIDIYGKIFNCNKSGGHGEVGIYDAYAQSCNTYFMNLASEIGYENIYNTAKKFGIGEKINLDGLLTAFGNLPPAGNHPPAFVANIAIGQGELLITPLEAARVMSAVANGGILPTNSLVKSMKNSSGSFELNRLPPVRVISELTAEKLREMMIKCVSEGTGVTAEPKIGGAGGKTSSAESGQFTDIADSFGNVQKTRIVHSWFVGFYPAAEPKFSISVLVEGGVTYGVKAAPVFAAVCDYLGVFLYD